MEAGDDALFRRGPRPGGRNRPSGLEFAVGTAGLRGERMRMRLLRCMSPVLAPRMSSFAKKQFGRCRRHSELVPTKFGAGAELFQRGLPQASGRMVAGAGIEPTTSCVRN